VIAQRLIKRGIKMDIDELLTALPDVQPTRTAPAGAGPNPVDAPAKVSLTSVKRPYHGAYRRRAAVRVQGEERDT
jgi:hypothetical protein